MTHVRGQKSNQELYAEASKAAYDAARQSRLVAPDGTHGFLVRGPDAHGRVLMRWDDGTSSWSQRRLLGVASDA